MSNFLQPGIILLREGTDESQGKGQVISNINACQVVVEMIKTTLGPRGMDKLISDGNKVTISNDGATIVQLLDIEHPAAKILADIAQSQDAEVGDGTTTVMILAGQLMEAAKKFISDGVHPRLIIKAFRKACKLSCEKIDEISIKIGKKNDKEKREILKKCAGTALTSKLIGGFHQDFFSEIAVDSVLSLDEDLDIDLIGIKQVPGGAMEESQLIKGVAFKKTFSYAGFEQQPKKFTDPKILLLNIELELKAERTNAEIKITDPDEYKSIVDAEWDIIYDKLDKIVKSGAKVILSKLAIGDLATQYFADRGIFCAGRVPEDDLNRVSKATGGITQTTVNNLIPEVLGTCKNFEEKQVGMERFNFFTGCKQAKTSTIILRGGAEQFIAEAERSLHDAIMIIRRSLKNQSIVAGGGAIDMALSLFLKKYSRTIKGKQQLLINEYAKALEIIPRQLSQNAGFDATDILTKLTKQHATTEGICWYGVNIKNEGICDTMKSFVWEPALVKKNAIRAATEACNLILSIDETIKNPDSEQKEHEKMKAQREKLF